jgi:LacI family transcriptional regulator
MATVDRVLNERGGVSPETAARVIDAARQLGIKRILPSPYRRRLRLDIILAQHDSPTISRLNRAVEAQIMRLGNNVALQRVTAPTNLGGTLTEAIIKSKSDGLIVFAPETAKVIDAIAAKTSSGIPVITLLSDLPTTPRLAYVGIDHFRAGRSAAFFLAQMLQPDAEVVLTCNNLDFRSEAERVGGFRAAWFGHARDDHKIHLVECGRRPRGGRDLIVSAVRSSELVGGIYDVGLQTSAVEQALRVSKLAGLLKVISHDLTEDNKRLLAENTLTLVIDQNTELQLQHAIDLFLARFGIAESGDYPTMVPFIFYVKDNVLPSHA